MKINNTKLKAAALSTILGSGLLASSAQATIVLFETPLGNFEVNLYDQTTPQTVANFLEYVEAGDYSNSIIHRSIGDFIVQGGGYQFDTEWPVSSIPANTPVVNEPVLSNLRGTIAMAKISGNPDSATNQWFINLSDNSGNLDFQNSGFTVFGEVVGDGMNVVDEIAAVPTYSVDGLMDLPLRDYQAGSTPVAGNLIMITSITVTDASVDSAAGLNPAPTLNNEPPVDPSPDSSSGGGTISGLLLALAGIAGFSRRRRRD